MSFPELVADFMDRCLANGVAGIVPEAILCGALVAVLLTDLLPMVRRIDPAALVMAALVAALVASVPATPLLEVPSRVLFDGMLTVDGLTVFARLMLLGAAALLVPLVKLTAMVRADEARDFYVLFLGALVGMLLMTSAGHLLMVFLAVEMASVPSYILVGIDRRRRPAAEGALKYALYGAAAAGVMLYGASLLVGIGGTANLASLGKRFAALQVADPALANGSGGEATLLALGAVMLAAGFAFKLSAFPVHFWCPDAFEGARAEVCALLSIASKTAALVLLLRVATMLLPTVIEGSPEAAGVQQPLPVREFVAGLVAVAAMATCTFGNLTAYRQATLKRMLAYSAIAQAGYLLMPLAAALALAGVNPSGYQDAVAATLFYAAAYGLANLAMFAGMALVRPHIEGDRIVSYAGLLTSCPVAAVTMSLALLSLVGLAPLVGFFGKLGIFQALAHCGSPVLLAALVVGGINTILSLGYYLNVAKVISFDSPPDTQPPIKLGLLSTMYLILVAAPLILLGLLPDGLADAASQAARAFIGS